MLRACILVASLCSCDALFRLSHVSTPDGAFDTPVIPQQVTGTLARFYLHQDTTFAPVAEPVPFDAGETPISVRLINGSSATVDWNGATGTFSFTSGAGEPYAVIVDGSTGPREYQSTVTELALRDLWLGHRDQPPPAATTKLEFDVGILPAADTKLIVSTGVWMMSGNLASLTSKYVVDWVDVAPQHAQRPALPRGSVHDAVHFHRLQAQGTTPDYTALIETVTRRVELGAGTTVATGPLVALDRSLCIDLYWRRATEHARMQNLYPQYGTPNGYSGAYSTPRPDLGLHALYTLVAVADQTDNHLAMQYGQPFTGHSIVVLTASHLSRPSVAGNLYAQTLYWDVITPTSTCERHDDPPPAFLPHSPRLSNVGLGADGIVLGLDPDEPAELTWTVDPVGTSAPMTVAALRRADNGMIVREFVTTESRVLIDPAVFAPGVAYTIKIQSTTAVPDAPTGDFSTQRYPFSVGTLDTPVFSVSQ